MATSTQNIQGAQFVQDLGKDYGTQLAGLTAVPLNTDLYAPQVAGQDAQQTQAYNLTGSGIGAYQPYISSAESYSGPTGYQSFMSPYQTDVIDASLASFDQQAGQGLQGIADQATMSGNLGGGREGVQRANYQAQSDLNRALLESGLLQQGFTQGNQLAQNAFSQQQSLANQVPSLNIQDVGQLGTMGGLQQAQAQAGLDATREQNRMRAQEPYERLGTYGQGVASLMSGYPGQYQTSTVPNPTPLQTALGTASVLGGIFGGSKNNYGNQQAQKNILGP
jgi:hypothetical protein